MSILPDAPATVMNNLRFETGFRDTDNFEKIVSKMSSSLDARLSKFREDEVEMILSVKDRDMESQKVTLETKIRRGRLVQFLAISGERDLNDALMDVRDDTRRQINRHLTKIEARKRNGR